MRLVSQCRKLHLTCNGWNDLYALLRRNIGRVSCADFALDRQSAIILPIDQASVDLVYGPPAAEKHDLVERIESRRTLPRHSGWAMTSTI